MGKKATGGEKLSGVPSRLLQKDKSKCAPETHMKWKPAQQANFNRKSTTPRKA